MNMAGLLSKRDKRRARWNSWRLRVFGNKPPFGISLKATTLEDALKKLAAQERVR